MMNKPLQKLKKKQASSLQLYYCEHCKKRLSYKTFCQHKKLFLNAPGTGMIGQAVLTSTLPQLPLEQLQGK